MWEPGKELEKQKLKEFQSGKKPEPLEAIGYTGTTSTMSAQQFGQGVEDAKKPKANVTDIEPLKQSAKKLMVSNEDGVYDNPRNREIFYKNLMKYYASDQVNELRDYVENAYAYKYDLQKYTKQVQDDPKDMNALYNLAYTQGAMGDYFNSNSTYGQLMQSDPTNMKPYYGLAYNTAMQGDIEGAIGIYDDAVKANPNDPNSYNNRAMLKWRNGDIDGALVDFNQTIQLAPNADQAYLNLAKLYKARGEEGKAIQFLDAGTKIAAENDLQYMMSRGQKIVMTEDDPMPHPEGYIFFGYTPNKQEVWLSPEEYKQQQYIKLQAKFADALSKGEGPLAFFNPIGAAGNAMVNQIPAGLKEIGRGLEALDRHMDGGDRYHAGMSDYITPGEAGLKIVKGTGEVVLGAAAPTPAGLTFMGAFGFAELTPPLQPLAHFVAQPVTTIYNALGGEEPTSEGGKDALAVGDLLGQILMFKAAEMQVSKSGANAYNKKIADVNNHIYTEFDARVVDIAKKLEEGIKITESDAAYIKEYMSKLPVDEVTALYEQVKAGKKPTDTIGSRITELDKQINQLAGKENVSNTDLAKIGELEAQREALVERINNEVGERTKELDGELESLRKEREELYKNTEDNIQVQKDAAREAEINARVSEILKQKQKVKGEIFKRPVEEKAPEQVTETVSEKPAEQVEQQKPEVTEEAIKEKLTPEELEEYEFLKFNRENGILNETEGTRLTELEAKATEVKEAVKEEKPAETVTEETPEVVTEVPVEEPVITPEEAAMKQPEVQAEVKAPEVKQETPAEVKSEPVEEIKAPEPRTEAPAEVKVETPEVKQEPVKETTAEKPANETPAAEEKAVETPAEDSVVDDPASVSRMDTDMKVLKALKGDKVTTKANAMSKRISEMKSKGLLSEETAEAYESAINDVVGKKTSKLTPEVKEKLKQSVIDAGEKLKDILTSESSKKDAADGKTIQKMGIDHNALIDVAVRLINKGIDAGFDIAKATEAAIEKMREHPIYKRLVEKGEVDVNEFEKKIRDSMPKEETPKEKKKSESGKKKKAVASRIANKSKASQAVKDIIKEKGLDYDIFSHEQAKEVAREIVSEYGIEEAIKLAEDRGNGINGSVRTMLYSEAINHFAGLEKAAESASEKQYMAERQADLAIKLDEYARDSGRSISAISELYRMSALGIEAKAKADIRRTNQRLLDNIDNPNESRRGKVKKVKKQVEQAKDQSAREAISSEPVKQAKQRASGKASTKPSFKPPKEKIESLRSERESLREALKQAKRDYPLTMMGINPRVLEIRVKIGLTYVKEGYVRFEAWKAKMKEEFDNLGDPLTEGEIEQIWEHKADNKKSSPELVRENAQSLAEIAEQESLNANSEKLANRIVNRINQPSSKRVDPVKMMIDTLLSKVEDKISPKEKKAPISAVEKIKRAIEERDEYADVWSESKEAVKEKIEALDISQSEKDAMNLELEKYFEEEIGISFSESQSTRALRAQMKNMGIKIDDILVQHPRERVSTRESLVDSLMNELGLEKDTASDIANAFYESYEKLLKSREKAILNKMFPDTAQRLINPSKRKGVHERIIEAINAGALDDVEFAKKFYEKFGLVDEVSPEVNAKLKEFAERIYNAPDGFMKSREYGAMLDYIANKRKEYLIMPIFYANILSSYETHIRNTQFNIPTATIAQMTMLAEKAFLNGNPKDFVQFYKIFLGGYERGAREAGAILKQGFNGPYDPVEARPVLDRMAMGGWKNILRWHKYPGRALRAADVLNTIPLSEVKQYELVLNEARARNMELPAEQQKSPSQITQEVNEIMGYTSERMEAAVKQAEGEMKRVYGENVNLADKKSQAYKDYKRRVFEIMEQSRPEAIKEQAIQWSKRALLTNKPEGSMGAVAEALTNLGQKVVPVKFLVPFVNVPLNIVNAFIDKGPFGYIRATRGKRGLFMPKELEVEMTPDQIQEAYIKATNYTTAIIGIAALTQMKYTDEDGNERPLLQVTGALTGDYKKNDTLKKGANLEPYTIYFMGERVFSYKYTPWAPAFAPVGYWRDYEEYGDDKSITSKIGSTFMSYISFVNDQAAMKGLNEALTAVADGGTGRVDPEYVKKLFAKNVKALLVPNIVSAANNDVRGMFDMNDKRAIEWWQYVVKDVPWAEEILRNKIDHLGRPVKDVFDVPVMDIPFTDIVEQTNDKYYRLFVSKKYFPTFYTQKNITRMKEVDGQLTAVEDKMTKTELDKLNEIRGKYVEKALSDPEIWENIARLDNEEFKEVMDDLFRDGAKYAKEQLFLNQ